MGLFFSCNSNQEYIGDFENDIKQSKVKWYISTNIADKKWQEAISSKVQKIDEHHISVSIRVILYSKEMIEARNYKSSVRFSKANQCLKIQQIFYVDNYLDLPEYKIRELMCDDIFNYLEVSLLKYQKRLYNLDVSAFIPLLKQRIQDIKSGIFEDTFYQTDISRGLVNFAKEIKEQISDDNKKVNR